MAHGFVSSKMGVKVPSMLGKGLNIWNLRGKNFSGYFFVLIFLRWALGLQ